ncbi:glutamine--fructose-6-phosphate transaminase (isomerizing), partial [Patescibacteria group bacterium]|nr:glutamine--fructose-6-phosphate transaminase (isomerizing) [Patescibacteria group bacterium]
MCGIFGYTGRENATGILLEGLRTLEYRGYDSAGIYVSGAGCAKAVGAVINLTHKIDNNFVGTSGIAHTRWATHGPPIEQNAHPHSDCSGTLWIVHNGIVENYKELKKELHKKGHTFKSQTDSEIIVHTIEEELKQTKSFEKAVMLSLKKIRGTYGIAVISKSTPDTIIVARMGSPIVLGIGADAHFVASDPSAILKHTKHVVYLDDGEMAVLSPTSYNIFTLDYKQLTKKPEHIEWDIGHAQKGGFEHFMLKEIMEGPEVLINSARGRVLIEDGTAKLGGLEDVADKLKTINRLIIVGCGSAYYAGLVGKYMLEEYAHIPVEVEIGSEFRYRDMSLDKHTAVLAISQSGETADTLASIKEAKRKGLLTLGIVNAVGSTIARETDAGVYNHAGPEIGVASTKAFLSQIEVLSLFTLFLGRQRGLTLTDGKLLAKEIGKLPEKVQMILEQRDAIQLIADAYSSYENFLFMGRKYNFPIAYEGALKLKEVSYVHAEGYGAGEMKHG